MDVTKKKKNNNNNNNNNKRLRKFSLKLERVTQIKKIDRIFYDYTDVNIILRNSKINIQKFVNNYF